MGPCMKYPKVFLDMTVGCDCAVPVPNHELIIFSTVQILYMYVSRLKPKITDA